MKAKARTCCAVVIGDEALVYCLLKGKKKTTEHFGVSVEELLHFSDCLGNVGCRTVALAGKGKNRKILFRILEGLGIRVAYANIEKSDDAEGEASRLVDLLEKGMLNSGSQVKIESSLSELLSFRRNIMDSRQEQLEHLQGLLEDGDVRLAEYYDDITTGDAGILLEGIMEGSHFTRRVVEEMLPSSDLPAPAEELARACNGTFSSKILWLMKMYVENINHYDDSIRKFETMIVGLLSKETDSDK